MVLASIPEAPAWPQLPALGLNERMDVQFSGGMPGVRSERGDGRIYFDTVSDQADAFAAFYRGYQAATEAKAGVGDFSFMAISPKSSQGISALENRLKAEGKKRPYIKVQTTGPCSFALTVTDESQRAIYHNVEFRDVIIKALAMKCRWQIQKFKPYGEHIICFIDEPILSAFGRSTCVLLRRDDVVAHLREVIDAVHAEGGLAGVHCCGDTDWSIFVEAGADILSLDAFGFGETIAIYHQAMKVLLERGGAIAWGIVPTSLAIREQTLEKLVAHFEKLADKLASRGLDKTLILEQAMITPSCGTGCLKAADAEKVFQMVQSVSQSLRAKHGA